LATSSSPWSSEEDTAVKEPLMSPREAAAYAAVLLVAVLSVPFTLHAYHTDSLLWRAVSLIPAGLLVAVAVSMTVGILSALVCRDADDRHP